MSVAVDTICFTATLLTRPCHCIESRLAGPNLYCEPDDSIHLCINLLSYHNDLEYPRNWAYRSLQLAFSKLYV